MERLPSNSLERALLLLQFIGKTPGGLTNLEISRKFSLARSTCSYILSRLEKEGYLARDKKTGRYRIGLKTLTLGSGALREAGFRIASKPTLYRLASDTGLAANLAVMQGRSVVILDRIEGPKFVHAAIQESGNPHGARPPRRALGWEHLASDHRDIGDEVPLCTTALGRVLLAHLPEPQLNTLLEQPSFSQEYSQETGLAAELAEVRRRGYCMMQFEPHNESCALAAPILDRSETVIAAVSVSCRRHLAIWNDEQALSGIVKEAAWEISWRLGYANFVRTDSFASAGPNDGGAVSPWAPVRSH